MNTAAFPSSNLDPATGTYKIPALRVLSEIATSLSTENNLEALLERFLGTMVKLAGADAGAVRVLTADGSHLRLVGSIGLPAEVVEQEQFVELECGLCGEATRKHSHRHSTNVQFCSERTSHSYFGSRCQHIIAVPLRFQGKVQGVYNLFMASDTPVPEDVALLFDSISEHLGMALENARLTRENMRITLMNERQMLANELHDSLAQTMAYMKMRLALLRDSMEHADTASSANIWKMSARDWIPHTPACVNFSPSSATAWTRAACFRHYRISSAIFSKRPAFSSISPTWHLTSISPPTRKSRCSISFRKR